MSAKLVSIQVGRIQSFEEEASKPWESGIAKLPVAGPVAVGKLKLSGDEQFDLCLLYTSPSPRDRQKSRMPSSA